MNLTGQWGSGWHLDSWRVREDSAWTVQKTQSCVVGMRSRKKGDIQARQSRLAISYLNAVVWKRDSNCPLVCKSQGKEIEGQGDEKQELLTKNQFRKRYDKGVCKTRVVGIKIWEHI